MIQIHIVGYRNTKKGLPGGWWVAIGVFLLMVIGWFVFVGFKKKDNEY